MHRTPLLMIPPLRGAKPPFGGPIKNIALQQFSAVSLRIPPLDFGGNAGRKFLSNEEYRPNITWLPLFSAILFFIGAHETRQNDLPLRGKTARAGCLTSYLVLVLFTSRDGSFRSSALFFSPLHFPPLFFSSPGKGECQIWFRIENFTGVQISFFCRKSGGKRRDGISEFSWSIERFFFFFFFFLECVGIMWKEYGGKLLNLIEREDILWSSDA